MGRKGKAKRSKKESIFPSSNLQFLNDSEFHHSVVYLSEGNQGSAIAISNTCREVLWGIVEVLSNVPKVTDISINEEEVIDDVVVSHEEECILPVEFLSKKVQQVQQRRKKKRKTVDHRDTNVGLSAKVPVLPSPPYSNLNVLLEHNVYKLSDDRKVDHFVKVLGVGSSTVTIDGTTTEYVMAKSLHDSGGDRIKEYLRDSMVDY